jgi:glycosyltransferase involved in cell wall biosynthesis
VGKDGHEVLDEITCLNNSPKNKKKGDKKWYWLLKKNMKLSIIIPVFNEEATVVRILDKVRKARLPGGFKKEIIVVDDGSTDTTRKLLQKESGIRIIKHKNNRGKGAAVRTGLAKSKGEIILIQDADLEYNPHDYSKLLKPILDKKAKVVYGSRLKNEKLVLFGKGRTPLPVHFIANRFLSFVTNMLYGNGITDMETCYKVFKREILKGTDLKANKFDFEPEITVKILKKGHEIIEVPIKVKPRSYKEGKKISWRDGAIALWTLIKYKFTD